MRGEHVFPTFLSKSPDLDASHARGLPLWQIHHIGAKAHTGLTPLGSTDFGGTKPHTHAHGLTSVGKKSAQREVSLPTFWLVRIRTSQLAHTPACPN